LLEDFHDANPISLSRNQFPLYTMFAHLRTFIELGNRLRFNKTHVGHEKLENCGSQAQQPPLKTTDVDYPKQNKVAFKC
jgi:hypothetical protein